MLKVTITYPNGISVAIETTDPNRYGELMQSAKQFLDENANGSTPVNGRTSATISAAANNHTQGEPFAAGVNESQANGNRHFREFCQRLAPSGDMRRVVAAAEGARRYLGLEQVSADELGPLFDTVHWPRPRNFVHTLRNAGRSSFGWMSKAAGNSGYYTVTEQGVKEITRPFNGG